jgi:serine/threonine-protein kinase
MGYVLAATHLTLDTPVAIKFLLAEHLYNKSIVERFMREARAAAKLRGEHVCRVSDVGTLEDGAPYIVMELLHGQDVSELASGHAMPVNDAVDLVLQACIGLAEAHQLGIVHRDLKPANLFITHRTDGSQCVKVVDFGIAKTPDEMSVALTTTSTMMGSPGYMSPEQMRSTRLVDQRTDIWSLGVILFELITGGLPFMGTTVTEMAIKIASDPTPQMAPMGHPGIEHVVRTCLEKSVDARYPDVATLAFALAPFGGPRAQDYANSVAQVLGGQRKRSITAPPGVPIVPTSPPMGTGNGIPRTPVPTTLASAVGSTSGVPERRGRGVLVGISLAVVAIAAVVIVVVMNGSRTATTTPSATPTEPAKTLPVATEPAKTEPAKTEPPTIEPPKTEPVKTEPATATTPPADAAVEATVDTTEKPATTDTAAKTTDTAAKTTKTTKRAKTTVKKTNPGQDYGNSRR